MTDKEQPSAQDSNQIIEERRAKLRELRTHGNAFPNDIRRSHLAAELHARHDAKNQRGTGAPATSKWPLPDG